MNILYILDYFSPHIGGVETLFSHITQNEVQNNNTVIVLTTKHDPQLASYEVINHVHIYRVGRTRMHWINMRLEGKKLIKQHNINLIHTSTYSAAMPARFLQYQYGIANILHVHEIYGAMRHRFLGAKAYCNKWFEYLVVGLLPRDAYHCVSRYTLNSVRTHYNLTDDRLYLITNPLDQEFWKPYDTKQEQQIRSSKIQLLLANNDRNTKYIFTKPYNEGLLEPVLGLYYGRTGVEKGLQLYIQALPEIIKLIPNFHAVIIAPCEEANPNRWSKRQTSHTLQLLIKQLGLESHISRISPVRNKQEIKEWIAACDIAILPSLTEGFGYAMHEVAMMNKKLITTQIGGQIETLLVNHTSKTVDSNDHESNIYWMQQVTSEEIVQGVSKLLLQHDK